MYLQASRSVHVVLQLPLMKQCHGHMCTQVWSTESGLCLRKDNVAHASRIKAIVLMTRGHEEEHTTAFATASSDGIVTLWRLCLGAADVAAVTIQRLTFIKTRQRITTLTCSTPGYSMAAAPAQIRMAAASAAASEAQDSSASSRGDETVRIAPKRPAVVSERTHSSSSDQQGVDGVKQQEETKKKKKKKIS